MLSKLILCLTLTTPALSFLFPLSSTGCSTTKLGTSTSSSTTKLYSSTAGEEKIYAIGETLPEKVEGLVVTRY